MDQTQHYTAKYLHGFPFPLKQDSDHGIRTHESLLPPRQNLLRSRYLFETIPLASERPSHYFPLSACS